jgi:hypothetical protein
MHTITRITAAVSTCDILPPCYVFGLARTNATQVRKFQNNRRCSLNIENETGGDIGICPPSCGEPLGEAADSKSVPLPKKSLPPGILVEAPETKPDMERRR